MCVFTVQVATGNIYAKSSALVESVTMPNRPKEGKFAIDFRIIINYSGSRVRVYGNEPLRFSVGAVAQLVRAPDS